MPPILTPALNQPSNTALTFQNSPKMPCPQGHNHMACTNMLTGLEDAAPSSSAPMAPNNMSNVMAPLDDFQRMVLLTKGMYSLK